MFLDKEKRSELDFLRQREMGLFAQVLTEKQVTAAAHAVGCKVGTSPLNFVNLTWLAVSSAWHPSKSFSEILDRSYRHHQDSLIGGSHVFSGGPSPRTTASDRPTSDRLATVSEEAFLHARGRVPHTYWSALIDILACECEQRHPNINHFGKFRLQAVDGSCVALPHTADHLEHFGAAGNGRGRKTPLARLVCVISPFTRLLHRYRLGEYTTSEVTLARDLFHHVQENDLMLMDRLFFSFGLFWQLQNKNAFFATRLKQKVVLKFLYKLGENDEIVRYSPSDWYRKWKSQNLPSSMDLRLIRYQLPGFPASAVVTNVLDPAQISRDDWIRLLQINQEGRVAHIAGLYHWRWEIETVLREIKCSLGLEVGLRSRKPNGIYFEVGGYLLLHALIRLLMVAAAVKANLNHKEARLSFTKCLNALEGMLWVAWGVPEEVVTRVLLPRLLERMSKYEVAFRPGRHFPRPGLKKKPH